jgi:hypothetical protein
VGDLHHVPKSLQGVAAGAQVQPPLPLHYRRGDSNLYAGWAILKGAP